MGKGRDQNTKKIPLFYRMEHLVLQALREVSHLIVVKILQLNDYKNATKTLNDNEVLYKSHESGYIKL